MTAGITQDAARKRQWATLFTVLTGAAGIGAVMAGLQPDGRQLAMLAEHDQHNSLATAYLQLLSRAAPNDPGLRILSSRNLARAGRWDDARAALAPSLDQPGDTGMQAAIELIEIDWLHLQSLASTDPLRDQAGKHLAAAIEKLASARLAPDAAARFSHICSALPAARFRACLSPQAVARATGVDARAQAARGLLADGQVRAAALVYREIATTSGLDRAMAREYTMRALDTFVAADDGQGALEFAAALLPQYQGDGAFILRVTEIALGQRDLALVRELGRSWLAQAPRDPQRIDRLLAAELATGNLEPALSLARRLVEAAPSAQNRMRLARVAEWNGQSAEALSHWSALARSGEREAIGRALALASQLGDDAAWFDAARVAMRRAPLSPEQLGAALALDARHKTPQLYAHFLASYVERHAAPADVWLALSAAQKAAGQPETALATLERMPPGAVAPADLALRQASLLADIGKFGAAFEKLLPWRAQVHVSNAAYWLLLGELSERGGHGGDALHAYQQAWRGADAAIPAAEWLIARYTADRDFTSAAQVGREAYARTRHGRWLLLAIDAAERGELRSDLLDLLAETAPANTALKGEPAYWLAKARLATREHDAVAATRALEKALALDAGDSDNRLRLVWTSINSGDKGMLARLLQRWKGAAADDSAYWQAFAAANITLGRPEAALDWLERHLARRPDDLGASFAYAEALANAGLPHRAREQRRRLRAVLQPHFDNATPAPQSIEQFGIAYAGLVGQFDGPAAAQSVLVRLRLRGHPDSELAEPMVTALLDQSKFEEARRWLDLPRDRAQDAPAWQRLAVALGRRDDDALAALLAAPTAALSPGDRIAGLQRLGRYPEALTVAESSIALPEFRHNQTLRSMARQLRHRLASRLSLETERETLDALSMRRVMATLSVPLGAARTTLAASRTRLRPSASGALAGPAIGETDLAATFDLQARQATAQLTLGANRRRGSVVGYARFGTAIPLREGVTVGFDTGLNAMSTTSAALRLRGKQDWAGANLVLARPDGAYVRADAAVLRYRTRAGEALASGMRVGTELGASVLPAYPGWKLRLAGRLERNRAHPAAASQEPFQGTGLAEQAGWAGVGSSLRFGAPDDDLGKPYGLIDAEIGRQWPDGRATHAARAELTIPLTRDARLRFALVHANSHGAIAVPTTRRAGVVLQHAF